MPCTHWKGGSLLRGTHQEVVHKALRTRKGKEGQEVVHKALRTRKPSRTRKHDTRVLQASREEKADLYT